MKNVLMTDFENVLVTNFEKNVLMTNFDKNVLMTDL
jgi:hypothetical protein